MPKIVELGWGIQMSQAKTSVGTALVGPPFRYLACWFMDCQVCHSVGVELYCSILILFTFELFIPLDSGKTVLFAAKTGISQFKIQRNSVVLSVSI